MPHAQLSHAQVLRILDEADQPPPAADFSHASGHPTMTRERAQAILGEVYDGLPPRQRYDLALDTAQPTRQAARSGSGPVPSAASATHVIPPSSATSRTYQMQPHQFGKHPAVKTMLEHPYGEHAHPMDIARFHEGMAAHHKGEAARHREKGRHAQAGAHDAAASYHTGRSQGWSMSAEAADSPAAAFDAAAAKLAQHRAIKDPQQARAFYAREVRPLLKTVELSMSAAADNTAPRQGTPRPVAPVLSSAEVNRVLAELDTLTGRR